MSKHPGRSDYVVGSAEQSAPVIGWFLPRHHPVDWTGEIYDPKTGEVIKEPSMTKQSFKEECDINNIVRKFEATGQIDHVRQATSEGLYQDLPSGLDLQSALDQINHAEAAFMALPADARAMFDNDPVQFVEGMTNGMSKEKADRLVELGLATARPIPDAPASPAPAGQGTGGDGANAQKK